MEKKYYIFLTGDIHPIGGMQNYVAGKARWLEENGWQVRVFFWGAADGKCKMSFLNRYLAGGTMELGTPPGEWTKGIRRRTLNHMMSVVGPGARQADTAIVESQDDTTALWGELLAERLHAKHMCFNCTEGFRGPRKHYAEYLDFFDFKHRRRELACIHTDSMQKLFEGYKKVKPEERYLFDAANEGPVQDVEDERVEKLKKYDWNICCIGRAEKTCKQELMKGIRKFAQNYPQKSIQFVMVGNPGDREDWIKEQLGSLKNVRLSFIGDMVPIPRSLFKKIDVVIASAGCAECAVYEGVPTIVMDVENSLANGILGYTTFSPLFHEKNVAQTSFDKALEQVLIEQIQANLEFHLEDRVNPADIYEKHMKFAYESDPVYLYDIGQNRYVPVNYMRVFKYYMRKYLPAITAVYSRIKRHLTRKARAV